MDTNEGKDARGASHSDAGLGLKYGDYVRNKKTGVRGDVMVIYIDAPYVQVVRHPSDLQGGIARWQKWPIEDVELVPNAELRGRAEGEGPVERSGTNLSAGLAGRKDSK